MAVNWVGWPSPWPSWGLETGLVPRVWTSGHCSPALVRRGTIALTIATAEIVAVGMATSTELVQLAQGDADLGPTAEGSPAAPTL